MANPHAIAHLGHAGVHIGLAIHPMDCDEVRKGLAQPRLDRSGKQTVQQAKSNLTCMRFHVLNAERLGAGQLTGHDPVAVSRVRRINGPVWVRFGRKVAAGPMPLESRSHAGHVGCMMKFSFHKRFLLYAGNRLNRQ